MGKGGQFIQSARQLRQLLPQDPLWVLDTETDGLQVVGPQSRDRAWIVGLAPSEADAMFYLDCGHPEWPEMLKALEETPLVGHNLKFDIHAMNARPKVPWLDTMGGKYRENTAGRKSLDDLFPGEKLPTLPELKGSGDSQNRIGTLRYGLNDWDPRLLMYLEDDVLKTKRLHADNLYNSSNLYTDLDTRTEYVTHLMEVRGVRLLRDKLDDLGAILGPLADEELAKIRALGFQGNVGSSQQLLGWLLDQTDYVRTEAKWDDEIRTHAFDKLLRSCKFRWKYKERGYFKASTDGKRVVGPLAAEGDPLAQALMEYRTYSKKKRDFVDRLPDFVQSDGLVHGQIRTWGTTTTRFSHANPNLGQIPKQNKTTREIERGRALRFRECFTGASGYMSGADFGQVEMRVAAALSGDANLLAAFSSGRDFHTDTACQVFDRTPETLRKEERFAVKQINFGILNGMQANRLAIAIGCRPSEAKAWREAYLARFQGLADWMTAVTHTANHQRYVRGVDGAIRIYDRGSGSVNNAVSLRVQGGAAFLMKHGLVACEEAGLRPVLSVHDEIVGDIKGRGPEYAETMAFAANNALPSVFGAVDFTAEGGHGDSWAAV